MDVVVTSVDLHDDTLDGDLGQPFASIRRVVSKVGKDEWVADENGVPAPATRAVVYVVQSGAPWWRTKIGELEFDTYEDALAAVAAELRR